MTQRTKTRSRKDSETTSKMMSELRRVEGAEAFIGPGKDGRIESAQMAGGCKERMGNAAYHKLHVGVLNDDDDEQDEDDPSAKRHGGGSGDEAAR